MDELMDLIIADESPSEISDGIKNVLFAKSAEKIDTSKPDVAQAMFGMYDADEDQGKDRGHLQHNNMHTIKMSPREGSSAVSNTHKVPMAP